jgi:hypothetical protein
VVGLYIDPPAHAVVLSVDEKSQIQALDRTQPGLPMKPGRAGTMTHDYKRNGTTTLFAALKVLDGTIISRNMKRHRHQEFIRFLNEVDAQVPKRKEIHAILDNYATHKHSKVRKWLTQHPRWTFHFTPTSASWLNAEFSRAKRIWNCFTRNLAANRPQPLGSRSGRWPPRSSSPSAASWIKAYSQTRQAAIPIVGKCSGWRPCLRRRTTSGRQ